MTSIEETDLPKYQDHRRGKGSQSCPGIGGRRRKVRGQKKDQCTNKPPNSVTRLQGLRKEKIFHRKEE
jgi:hypothetical protein